MLRFMHSAVRIILQNVFSLKNIPGKFGGGGGFFTYLYRM